MIYSGGRRWTKMSIKLLWTREKEGQVHRGRTLIAKKTAYYGFYLRWTGKFSFLKKKL
jgi:hypothetical protein